MNTRRRTAAALTAAALTLALAGCAVAVAKDDPRCAR